jgi:hypothetical protein
MNQWLRSSRAQQTSIAMTENNPKAVSASIIPAPVDVGTQATS